MEYLIIFNFLVSISIVIYFIYTKAPFYFKVNRTFWYKKPHSITLWHIKRWQYYDGKRRPKTAVGLFTIPFRNRKKLEKWDRDKFTKNRIVLSHNN